MHVNTSECSRLHTLLRVSLILSAFSFGLTTTTKGALCVRYNSLREALRGSQRLRPFYYTGPDCDMSDSISFHRGPNDSKPVQFNNDTLTHMLHLPKIWRGLDCSFVRTYCSPHYKTVWLDNKQLSQKKKNISS